MPAPRRTHKRRNLVHHTLYQNQIENNVLRGAACTDKLCTVDMQGMIGEAKSRQGTHGEVLRRTPSNEDRRPCLRRQSRRRSRAGRRRSRQRRARPAPPVRRACRPPCLRQTTGWTRSRASDRSPCAHQRRQFVQCSEDTPLAGKNARRVTGLHCISRRRLFRHSAPYEPLGSHGLAWKPQK